MKEFDFEERRIKEEIAKVGAKRVLLQLPEGFKPEGVRLAKLVEKCGALPIISADPCYGACDIAASEAEALGADLIIHFGHSELIAGHQTPTAYFEVKANVSIDQAVQQALPLLAKYSKVGLATSVQHLQTLAHVEDILVKNGKKVVIGNSGQIANPGQVLGCNYSNVKSIAGQVDSFLFVGGGLFHALGVALATSKPTVVADPYDNRAFSVDDEAKRIIRKRWASVEEAMKAKNFGVFVGLKPGQKKVDLALKIRELAEKHGCDAYLFAAREITPETILEFPSVDAYVNTACPRISLDASHKFSKPVISVNEFMVVIGESSWESMLKKGLFES